MICNKVKAVLHGCRVGGSIQNATSILSRVPNLSCVSCKARGVMAFGQGATQVLGGHRSGCKDNTEGKLAPLNARRDMAILGLIQRTVLGRGPKHFRQYFKDAGKRTLVDPRHTNNEHILRCSALGLVATTCCLRHCGRRDR